MFNRKLQSKLRKRDIITYLFSYYRQLAFTTFVVSFFAGLTTLMIPLAIGKYYGFLFDLHSFRAQLLDFLPFDLSDIHVFIGFFVALVVLKTILSYGERYYSRLLGEKFVFSLRQMLFESQLNIPIEDYENRGFGRYLLRFSGDLNSLKNYFCKGIVQFIGDLIWIALAIIILVSLDSRLGLILFIGLIPVFIVILLFGHRLSRTTRQQRNQKSGLLSFTATRLRAIHSIRFFNKEAPELAKFSHKAKHLLTSSIAYQKILSLIHAMIPGLLYLMLAAMFYYVSYAGMNQDKASGSKILIFVILLLTILPILRRILKINIVWELGTISFEKFLQVLNRSDFTKAHLPDYVYQTGKLEIKNLSYQFESKEEIFHNLNMAIDGPGIHLVYGKAGSGKSTLVKLITGLYQATEDAILLDGQDVQQVNGKSLRRHIVVVSNEIQLLGKTVFEAISYSRKANKRPAAQFLLDHLFEGNPALPQLSLNDPIGEAGNKLSKGQQQLLAYARALLTRKKIILIDEPFEGIGDESISFWVKEIRQLAKKKTVIIFSSKTLGGVFKPASVFHLNHQSMKTSIYDET